MAKSKKTPELLTTAEQHYVKSFHTQKSAEVLAGELSLTLAQVNGFLDHMKASKRSSLPLPNFKEGTYYLTESMAMAGDKRATKANALAAQIAEAVGNQDYELAASLKRQQEEMNEPAINPVLEPHISPTYRDR